MSNMDKFRICLLDLMREDFNHEEYYRAILKEAIEEKIRESQERKEKTKRFWRF